MGKTPGQLEEEIEGLRRETDAIVNELERRANPASIAGAVTGAARTAVGEIASQIPEISRHGGVPLVSAALSALTGLIVFGLSTVVLGHPDTASERELDGASARTGVRIGRAKAGRSLRGMVGREERGTFKRVLWVALASGMAALGSMLFRRLTAQLWRNAMREEPPSG